jgi:uncharacterized protein (DUF1697 family)
VTAFVALLRAVNVGGTGKLAMSDLKVICEAAGLERVRTYIASGNVVFRTDRGEAEVKAAIEAGLLSRAGKPVGVLVRSAEEMAAVCDANPFPERAPDRTLAIFLDAAPSVDALDRATDLNGEEMQLGRREIYVHYGNGMAGSKLKIPAAAAGTARNMNTLAKLAEMARELLEA